MIFAADGILEWLNLPAAIRVGNTTFFCYQSFSHQDDPMDSVWVNSYTHTTAAVGTPYKLRAYTVDGDGTATADDHGSPAIAVDAEGHLVCAYAKHHGPLWVRRSSQPFDHTTFGPEQMVDGAVGGAMTTYPQIYTMPDGVLVLLYRRYEGGSGSNSTSSICVRRSTDNGQSWSAATQIIRQAGMAAYHQSCQIGPRIDIALTPFVYAENKYRHVYHAYSDDGGLTWRDTGGLQLALPMTESTMTQVYADTTPQWSWAFDIQAQVAGDPRIVLYSNLGGYGDSSRVPKLRYAKLIDGAWVNNVVCDAPSFWSGLGTYPCGAAIDPANVERLVVSQGANGTGVNLVNPLNNVDCTARLRWYDASGRAAEWFDASDGFHIRPQFVRRDGGMVLYSDVAKYVSMYNWESTLLGVTTYDLDVYLAEAHDLDVYLGSAGSRRRFALLNPVAPTRL